MLKTIKDAYKYISNKQADAYKYISLIKDAHVFYVVA